jgi:hypothetical protein
MLATFKAHSFGSQALSPVARAIGLEVAITMLSTFRVHTFRARTFDAVARAIFEATEPGGVDLVINPQYVGFYYAKDYIAYLLAKNYTARYNGD